MSTSSPLMSISSSTSPKQETKWGDSLTTDQLHPNLVIIPCSGPQKVVPQQVVRSWTHAAEFPKKQDHQNCLGAAFATSILHPPNVNLEDLEKSFDAKSSSDMKKVVEKFEGEWNKMPFSQERRQLRSYAIHLNEMSKVVHYATGGKSALVLSQSKPKKDDTDVGAWWDKMHEEARTQAPILMSQRRSILESPKWTQRQVKVGDFDTILHLFNEDLIVLNSTDAAHLVLQHLDRATTRATLYRRVTGRDLISDQAGGIMIPSACHLLAKSFGPSVDRRAMTVAWNHFIKAWSLIGFVPLDQTNLDLGYAAVELCYSQSRYSDVDPQDKPVAKDDFFHRQFPGWRPAASYAEVLARSEAEVVSGEPTFHPRLKPKNVREWSTPALELVNNNNPTLELVNHQSDSIPNPLLLHSLALTPPPAAISTSPPPPPPHTHDVDTTTPPLSPPSSAAAAPAPKNKKDKNKNQPRK